MSSKLFKMKFMATAMDTGVEEAAAAAKNESRAISESHWRLKFVDDEPDLRSKKLQTDSSYTTFMETVPTGRFKFQKGTRIDNETRETNGQEEEESDDEEPGEDAYARRQQERQADKDSLRKLKSIDATSISGNATNSKLKRKGMDSTPKLSSKSKRPRP